MRSNSLLVFLSLAVSFSSAEKARPPLSGSLHANIFPISSDKQDAAMRCYSSGFECDIIFDQTPVSTKFIALPDAPVFDPSDNQTIPYNMTERFSTKILGRELVGLDSSAFWATSISMNTFKLPTDVKHKKQEWIAVATAQNGSLRIVSVLVDNTIHPVSCTTVDDKMICGIDLNEVKPKEVFVPVTFQIINVPTYRPNPSLISPPTLPFSLLAEADIQVLSPKHTGMLRVETMAEKTVTFSFNGSIVFQELPMHGDIFLEHNNSFAERNVVYQPFTRFVYESLSNIEVVGGRTDVVTYATLAPDSSGKLARFNEYLQFNRIIASDQVVFPSLTIPLNLYLGTDNILRSNIQHTDSFWSTSVIGSLPDTSGKFEKSTDISQRNNTFFPVSNLLAVEDGFSITENGEFTFEAPKVYTVPELYAHILTSDKSEEGFKKLLDELNITSPIRVPLKYIQTLQDGNHIPGAITVEYHLRRFDLQASSLSPIPSLTRLDRLPPEFIRVIAWTCVAILGAIVVISLTLVILRKSKKPQRRDLESNAHGHDKLVQWKTNPIYQPPQRD